MNFKTCAFLIAQLPVLAMSQTLSKVEVTSELVDSGRAMVTAERGNFLIVDSVPPLDGPNKAMNPTELMVGSLATCATFVAKASLESMKKPFDMVKATAEGDFTPKSVKTGEGDPSFKNFRVVFDMTGVDKAAQDSISAAMAKRCPIYATLSKAAPIAVTFDKKSAPKAEKGLTTVAVSSKIFRDGTRAHINSRDHFLVVDNVVPLGGKNETLNPLDLMLAAQSTCVLFVAEAVSKKAGTAMGTATATVSGQFDPRGVKGEDVNPRIQTINVTLNMPNTSAENKTKVSEEIKKRCPVYTTLSKSAEVTIQ